MKQTPRNAAHGLAMAAALWLATGASHAGTAAHVHGLMRLDIAIDKQVLTVQLASPLDSLLGFERAPRTPAERQAADAVLKRMGDTATLFKPDAAAQCVPTNVRIESAALQSVAAAPGKDTRKDSEHADLDASYEFTCAQPDQLTTLEVGLFDAFKRLKKIEVQVAGANTQSKQTLKRPNKVISLSH